MDAWVFLLTVAVSINLWLCSSPGWSVRPGGSLQWRQRPWGGSRGVWPQRRPAEVDRLDQVGLPAVQEAVPQQRGSGEAPATLRPAQGRIPRRRRTWSKQKKKMRRRRLDLSCLRCSTEKSGDSPAIQDERSGAGRVGEKGDGGAASRSVTAATNAAHRPLVEWFDCFSLFCLVTRWNTETGLLRGEKNTASQNRQRPRRRNSPNRHLLCKSTSYQTCLYKK